MNNTELLEVLHIDPLGVAEGLTGTSYKEDEDTQWLGFGIMQEKNSLVKAELLRRDDTVFFNDLDRYERIITHYGFEQVLDVPFTSRDVEEHLYAYWHPYGLLLHFDTYKGVRVNGGKVQYCWKPADPDANNWWRLTSSGGFYSGVWVGHHDCREALIFNLENLFANGEFVNPWPALPFMWLLHHGDTKIEGYDYKAITDERIALLPENVLEGMGIA